MACFTFSATYWESGVNDDLGDRSRQPKIAGFLEGLDAGLEFHLVVRGAFVARMPGVRDLFVAASVDQEEADPNAATSRRRKGGAIGVDVQRVLGKHPAPAAASLSSAAYFGAFA
jgi:hypothetical protein